jgi:hypothetical protein
VTRRQRPHDISGNAITSPTDPAVLKVLLKVKPGLGEGYHWVEWGACGARLAGSPLVGNVG